MGEVKRYDIYETSDRGMNIDIDQDGGEWVSYDDHADVIQRLLKHSATRERMNGQTIATLRAEVERWVKEVARLKLSAEKAERDAGNKFGFK